jgi:large subunit GTPase 1
MSQKKYEVLNEQIVLQTLNAGIKDINENQFSKVFLSNVLKNSEIKLYQSKPLSIPKRPRWKEGIPVREFERLEKEAFLNWRRALAEEEEKNVAYSITPFEKNLEVWRQLWITVEKSDVLIIIVDGRNPLYYRVPDLENYIKEVDKKKDFILLINKSDLLNDDVRRNWADYFKENNINYIFFSALEEAKKIEIEEDNIKDLTERLNQAHILNNDNEEIDLDNEFKLLDVKTEEEDEEQITNNDNIINNKDKKEENITSSQNENKVIDDNIVETKIKETEINQNSNNENNIKNDLKQEESQSNSNENKIILNSDNVQNEEIINNNNIIDYESIKIFNRDELINHLYKFTANKPKYKNQGCYFYGFIGFPNVGKSSVINVLMRKKKVNKYI